MYCREVAAFDPACRNVESVARNIESFFGCSERRLFDALTSLVTVICVELSALNLLFVSILLDSALTERFFTPNCFVPIGLDTPIG